MEKNHPGFNSDIKDPNQPAYKAFVESLEKKIAADPNGKYCIAYLKQYLFYLKDHHINIIGSVAVVKEDSAAAVEAFLQSAAYVSTERMAVDSAEVMNYLQQLKSPGYEGIYRTADGTYTIAVLKKPNETRDYAGIILSAKTKLWDKGQVKIELKQANDSVMQTYLYLRNHSLSYDEAPISKNDFTIPGGWIKVFPAETAGNRQSTPSELFSFKVLDENTAYMYIKSFSGSYSTYLDSAYKAVIPEIRKHRNLIIDIRNNGGGSDLNYKALMPYIFTDAFTNDVVDYYATPDNIKAYEILRDEYKSKPEIYGKNGYANWEYGAERMKKAGPNSFILMRSDMPSQTTYKRVKGYPEKVAIIQNRNSASSAESLIFEARESKKVITVGENSGGYTGYGNVMNITTPCGNSLSWTTTRYRNQRQYDFTGIPPQYRVPASESDWVEYTRRLLQ